MFVYVDESGDSGFKIGRGSSEYFVIGMVIVENPVPVVSALVELKTRLNMRQQEEIRFNKSSERFRLELIEEVRKHDLTICGFCVNKRLLVDSPSYRSKEWFYSSLIARALEGHAHRLNNATLVFDEYMTNRRTQRAMNTTVRNRIQQELGEIDGVRIRRVKDIVHRGSHIEPLLQIADLVAGAIHYDRNAGGGRYLEFLLPRIAEIHDWHGED